MRTEARLVALAVAAAVPLLVCGCSAESSAAASLATTASDASAAAQTVSYDLRLELDGRVTPGVSSTALGDAITQLQEADSTLTGSQEPTAVQKLATQTLTLVRRAEDATQQAQVAIDKSSKPSTLTALDKRLHQISESLSKVENKAKAHS
jgi:hypothetical protein